MRFPQWVKKRGYSAVQWGVVFFMPLFFSVPSGDLRLDKMVRVDMDLFSV